MPTPRSKPGHRRGKGRASLTRLAAPSAGAAIATAVPVYLRWIRPHVFTWGATPEEAKRPMPGDDVCQRTQLNATRAVTIAARPEEVWPWLVQWGWNRAGFYSYDLLDNRGRRSAEEILPRFQRLAVGDWVPMSGNTTPYTAFLVTRLEPGKLMLWEKGGGTWLWLLEPIDSEHTRLITRMRGRYRWTRPTIVTELMLMEIGDPFMMRKCLLGITQRAERLATRRRLSSAGAAGRRLAASGYGRRRHQMNSSAKPAFTNGHGNKAVLTLIKAVHILAWLSIESCMMYVLYAGFARRTDRRAAIAGTVVAGETLIFAANGFRCPLTNLAENFGAADGSVTDIWLSRWLAHNLPAW